MNPLLKSIQYNRTLASLHDWQAPEHTDRENLLIELGELGNLPEPELTDRKALFRRYVFGGMDREEALEKSKTVARFHVAPDPEQEGKKTYHRHRKMLIRRGDLKAVAELDAGFHAFILAIESQNDYEAESDYDGNETPATARHENTRDTLHDNIRMLERL